MGGRLPLTLPSERAARFPAAIRPKHGSAKSGENGEVFWARKREESEGTKGTLRRDGRSLSGATLPPLLGRSRAFPGTAPPPSAPPALAPPSRSLPNRARARPGRMARPYATAFAAARA